MKQKELKLKPPKSYKKIDTGNTTGNFNFMKCNKNEVGVVRTAKRSTKEENILTRLRGWANQA